MHKPYLINCDMGESFGNYSIGNDREIMPLINAANIACGMHGGDPYHIEKTILLALENGVKIGAHPGYPDLQGFGRRVLPMQDDELASYIKYQVAALQGLVAANGGQLEYVKPHGALYNHIAQDANAAQVVVNAIRQVDPSLKIMGLAGSHMKEIVTSSGATFIAEAFADRTYEANGQLRSRSLPNSLINDSDQACQQVVGILEDHEVKTYSGEKILLEADSFCIHGDNPAAVSIATALNSSLNQSPT